MSTWTQKDISTARACIESATTLSAGYAAAAGKLSRTSTSIRLAHERGTLGPDLKSAGTTTQDQVAALREKQLIDVVKAENKRLVEAVAAREEELALFKSIARDPKPIKAPKTKGLDPKQIKACAVVEASDWHVEEPVYPETVNGLNEYNLEIADARIKHFEKSVIWLLSDPRFDIRAMVLGLLGDLISGYIHEELIESNLLSPGEAIIWLLDRLEAMLRRILSALSGLERVIVVCKSGNHGRLTHKQKVSTREANSIEQVLYQALARLFRDEERIEFVITPGIWTFVTAFDFDLAFTHGDSFKSGGGVGGVGIPIRKGITREFIGRHRPVHQFHMGHFHQRQDFGNIQLNGSLIGYSPYSQQIHAEYEEPQQSLYLLVKDRGKGPTSPVWVADENKDPRSAESWRDGGQERKAA